MTTALSPDAAAAAQSAAATRLPRDPGRLARLGAGVALSAAALAAVGTATSSSLLLAPFAASAALKHAAPHGPLARPRNVIGGYLVGASVGVAVGFTLGSGFAAVALATALAAVLMTALHVEHPPAVAMTLIALQAPGPWPLEVAAAGSITLVVTMLLLAPTMHRTPSRNHQGDAEGP